MLLLQVIMHAISRDPAAYAKACVYLQLDDGNEDAAMMPDDDDDEEGSASGEVAAEVRLVPGEDAKGALRSAHSSAHGLASL